MQKIIAILAKWPVLITVLVCVVMYILTGATSNTAFFNLYTFVNLFQNQAGLGVVAIGMTFIILTGGIDLSVGSIVGWTALMAATLMHTQENGQLAIFHGWNPYVAMATVLVVPTIIGAIIGVMVHHLEIPPFLITLAFLFLYRGWALVVTTEEVHVTNTQIVNLSEFRYQIHDFDHSLVPVKVGTLVLLAVVAIGAWLGRYTGFGRSLYAIGGSENSANLMGLPVARSKVIVYALGGFCAALGGLLYFIKDGGGSALRYRGMELDAIAVAVIGGTLLTGGVGGVIGTLVGLLTWGIIQAAMSRHSFPTGVDRIVIGGLLLAFILLQKLLQLSQRKAR